MRPSGRGTCGGLAEFAPPDPDALRVLALGDSVTFGFGVSDHEAWPAVLVAGTKGKGSVCALVASALGRAGLRVGVYASPHVERVTERVRSGKISTIYGVGMPYWMRLSGSVYGVHAGYLPGYPASAGCIRLPRDAAQLIYDNTKYGTQVSIYSSWQGAQNQFDPAGSET